MIIILQNYPNFLNFKNPFSFFMNSVTKTDNIPLLKAKSNKNLLFKQLNKQNSCFFKKTLTILHYSKATYYLCEQKITKSI